MRGIFKTNSTQLSRNVYIFTEICKEADGRAIGRLHYLMSLDFNSELKMIYALYVHLHVDMT